MSEAYRLLQSGCLWTCVKSPFGLIQTNTGQMFFLFYFMFLQHDLDKRHHTWTSCASQPNHGRQYGLFSICYLNNITWDKRSKHWYMCRSDHRMMAPYQLFHSSLWKQHMLYWSAHSRRNTCCLLSGSIFSWAILTKLKRYQLCHWSHDTLNLCVFNNHTNMINTALLGFLNNGWNDV